MSIPATEDFAGAAGALSGSWTQQNTQTIDRDGAGLGVVSGADGTNGSGAFWNADTFSANQLSKLTWKSGAASSAYAGASVRCSGTSNATTNRYIIAASGDGGASGQTRMSSVVNGTATTLADYAQAWSDGDVIEIRADGTSIRAYRNGTALGAAVTNSALTTGQPGIFAVEVVATSPTFDDWTGDNIYPTFTVQPTDQTVADGGTAAFTTTVIGATSYQWETLAPLGGSWGNVSGGTGATSDDYTTGTLSRASDAGRQYRLKATNANGDTYSNVVQARVTAIPTAYDFGGFVIGANS